MRILFGDIINETEGERVMQFRCDQEVHVTGDEEITLRADMSKGVVFVASEKKEPQIVNCTAVDGVSVPMEVSEQAGDPDDYRRKFMPPREEG